MVLILEGGNVSDLEECWGLLTVIIPVITGFRKEKASLFRSILHRTGLVQGIGQIVVEVTKM